MPEGVVRTDLNKTGTDYLHGFPVTEPLNFGQPITEPHSFGATITPNVTTNTNGNPVTEPKNFGNMIGASGSTSGFELEDGSGVILLESGDILLLEVQ